MSQPTIERAAGGVVVRLRNGIREVLLIDDQYNRVSFAKGHVEKGETWEDTALREVAEETGISARIIAPLGRVEYPITRSGHPVQKQVRLFLMEALDASAEPVTQVEELESAYYLPWDEAITRVSERGYENWKWLMDRADVEWQWYEGDWEKSWRNLPGDAKFEEARDRFLAVRSLCERFVTSVEAELTACVPEWTVKSRAQGSPSLPRVISDEGKALLEAIEHTLLRPTASTLDIERLCSVAKEHGFHAVCVNPQHVALASSCLEGTTVKVCSVVGFPLGATDTRALQAEVEAVVARGASEVDMVIPIGSLCEDDIWTTYQHVAAAVREAHMERDVTVKVILETCYLTLAQVVKGCLVAVAAGADFVKTSTGFAPGGARFADVAIMALSVNGALGIKAAGGIKSRAQAETFLRFGASRLGTSNGVGLLSEG